MATLPLFLASFEKKDVLVGKEEIVRQLWLNKILDDLEYTLERIEVERNVTFGSSIDPKRADIVILHKDGNTPYIIFEVKKPGERGGLNQLKSYCNAEGSPIAVLSNGGETTVLHREEPNTFVNLPRIPSVREGLQDILKEPWNLEKLKKNNRLVLERVSLKSIILDLEDLVLANAEGVDDSFDEVFKLLYAKLYDEKMNSERLKFRVYARSNKELFDAISDLLEKAKDKWPGVFLKDEKIKLKEPHLKVCVSFLQNIMLFNSNLQVIDDAFEYLITEVAKGKKGQFFTPRWVIDMAVKILDPKQEERVVDPACGSAGFLLHSVLHIAGGQIDFGRIVRYCYRVCSGECLWNRFEP